MAALSDTSRPITLPVVLLTLFCCLVWSANSVAIKFTTDHIPPIGAAGIRFGIGLVPIALWALWSGIPLRPRRAEIPVLVFHGLLLFVQISLLNWGTKNSEAARSSILIAAHVVFVALLAPLVAGGDRLTARRVAGFATGGVGLAVVFGDQLRIWRPDILVGDLTVLLSAFLLGFKMTHVKRSIVTLDPARFLFWQGMIAVPIFMAWSFGVEGIDAYAWARPAFVAVVYQGLFVTGFCFICWTTLLRRHDAGALAIFGFASPLFGVALSILLRTDEHATFPLVVGAALVAVGIMLATTRREAKRPSPRERAAA